MKTVILSMARGHSLRAEAASGCEKLFVGLQTDTRMAFLSLKLNPMDGGVPLEYAFEDEEALVRTLSSLRAFGRTILLYRSALDDFNEARISLWFLSTSYLKIVSLRGKKRRL